MWSGAGIDLRINQASRETVCRAARQILDGLTYRDRVRALAEEFEQHATEAEWLELLATCVKASISKLDLLQDGGAWESFMNPGSPQIYFS